MGTPHAKRLLPRFGQVFVGGFVMCEFNVIVNGKPQFKDVVYAKAQDGNVLVKNVLGESKEFQNCVITEVT
jgi:predicted RNA-binding protein